MTRSEPPATAEVASPRAAPSAAPAGLHGTLARRARREYHPCAAGGNHRHTAVRQSRRPSPSPLGLYYRGTRRDVDSTARNSAITAC